MLFLSGFLNQLPLIILLFSSSAQSGINVFVLLHGEEHAKKREKKFNVHHGKMWMDPVSVPGLQVSNGDLPQVKWHKKLRFLKSFLSYFFSGRFIII